MLYRARSLIIPLAISMTVLTSCSSTDGFSDLDREPQGNDSLPDAVNLADGAKMLLDSSRSVGTYEGTELWLVRTEDDGVCLVAYTDEMDWVAGCGESPPLEVSGSPGNFTVVSDGQSPPENATRISENVFVFGR